MMSVRSIAAAVVVALPTTLAAADASADPFTLESGCASENNFCKFTIQLPPKSNEIRFVSCTFFAKEGGTSFYKVQLTVGGARTSIPLSWQRLNDHGPREIFTFSQQLLLFHGGRKLPEFLISATGPFEGDCTVSGL